VPTCDYSFNLGGGGLLSTAEDLARFGERVTGPGLLTAEARQLFLSDAWFGRSSAEGQRWALITGSNPGVQAGLAIFPGRRTAAAVLANTWGLGARSAEMDGNPGGTRECLRPVRTTSLRRLSTPWTRDVTGSRDVVQPLAGARLIRAVGAPTQDPAGRISPIRWTP
jgi:CubicO group peptidase (beta-lactamase class C family)